MLKRKSMFMLALILIVSIMAIPVQAEQMVQEKVRVVEVDLEVGESFIDSETGITIVRLEDDVEKDNPIAPRAYSEYLWEIELKGKDVDKSFKLTNKANWWKIAYRTYTDGNNIEVSRGTEDVKTVYKQSAGRYDLYNKDIKGTYKVHFCNGNNGLDGWAACRIADSKAGLDLR